MKHTILLFFFLLPLAAHSACLTGSEGALELYSQEEAIQDLSILEIDEISSKGFLLYRVTNGDSCGVRGCDFSLYVVKEGCLFSAFNAYSAKLKPSSSWNSITVIEKALPVDGPSRTQVYEYDKKSFKYVLKK